MFDAMITNAWLASQTEQLRVGSLVLCDSFRHPAVLAREAVTLDHASGGRFELGIGWGSVVDEMRTFGIGSPEPKERLGRLRESLEIMKALWAGETLDYEGEHFTLHGAQQQPGTDRADPDRHRRSRPRAPCGWWPRTRTGGTCIPTSSTSSTRCGLCRATARCSLQVQVAFVPPSGSREEIEATARRRFGTIPIVGTGPELVDYFGSLQERGVERVYAWFCDFAPPDTLAAFGEAVIRPSRRLCRPFARLVGQLLLTRATVDRGAARAAPAV